jgi:DNA invertase Pin-like site-specific DNA recombinase
MSNDLAGSTIRRRKRRNGASAGPVRAILYARVSTSGQAEQGGSLVGQLDALDRLASSRDWLVVDRLTDERSGSSLDRPSIAAALRRLASGEANLLAVSRLDRLSRSVQDFANLVQQSRDEGWRLVIADIGFDGSSPAGLLVANVLSALSQWERQMIGTRTSEGIAALRAMGRYRGVKVSPEIRDRIIGMRERGLTYQAMSDALNAEGIASPGGKTWGPKTAWGIVRGSYRSVQDQTSPLNEMTGR